MTPRRVHVHIDALVLRGFAPGQRDAVAAGLQAELGRLLAEPGERGFGEDRSLESIRLGEMRIGSGAGGARIGRQAAGRVAEGIRR